MAVLTHSQAPRHTRHTHTHTHRLTHTRLHTRARLQSRRKLLSWDQGTSQDREWGRPWLGVVKGWSYFAAVAAALKEKGWSKVTQRVRAHEG